MGVVVITGGSRGIGAATAREVAAAGWDVCVGFVADAPAAERIVADCLDFGVRATAVRADVAQEAGVLALFAAADALGPVVGLINAAGIVAPRSLVQDMTAERISRMFAVNTLGPFLCCREAVRRMTVPGAGGGSIVNVSSRAATIGSPGRYVDYAASKAAVDTLTLGLAKEVAGLGIRVNGVRPGIIDTEIHASAGDPDRVRTLAGTIPMGRPGTAAEIAKAITWLLGDEASYVTGAMLDVGGGL